VAARRLQDVDRADHVHPGAERRVRLHERHLQSREMDEVRDLVPGQRALELVEVGHVAAD